MIDYFKIKLKVKEICTLVEPHYTRYKVGQRNNSLIIIDKNKDLINIIVIESYLNL